MSAFFVGSDHINAMLTVLQHTGLCWQDHWVEKPCDRILTDMGKIFIFENIQSLKYRYPGNYLDMVGGSDNEEIECFTFEPDLWFHSRAHVKDMAKLFQCYEYQSCEHPTWARCYAERVVNGVYSSLFRQLPDHPSEINPWGYTKPADAPKVISLSRMVRA